MKGGFSVPGDYIYFKNQVHLYGTSFGGVLAQLFSQHRPRATWTPSFLFKQYILTGIRNGPHEPYIADSVDFVVSQVETLPKNDLASRLTLTPDTASVNMLSCLPSIPMKRIDKNIGIFWDLDNKPPKSCPPYDAAIRLKKAMTEFGFVKYLIAYANRHAFSYVPPEVAAQRKQRKEMNRLERKGIVKPNVPYICKVCGRKFYTNEKLINHFKQIHDSEQRKRLNRIESARGKRRVKLVGMYSMKMEKYRIAARDILTPKVGYGLAGDLKRAGYWVRTVADKPQAADVALRNHMVDMMDKKLVDCLVLVSDDSDFVGVLKEAKLRCLKTIVVGDIDDGILKRTADAAFSWQEILKGKAKKEAVSVVERWKDRDVLKRLEWTYDPETEKELHYSDFESEDSDVEDFFSGDDHDDGGSRQPVKYGPWWKLEPDTDTGGVNSFTQSEK